MKLTPEKIGELREAAEGAIGAERDLGIHEISCADYDRIMSEYREKHSDPETFLALLDEIERLRELVEAQGEAIDSLWSATPGGFGGVLDACGIRDKPLGSGIWKKIERATELHDAYRQEKP